MTKNQEVQQLKDIKVKEARKLKKDTSMHWKGHLLHMSIGELGALLWSIRGANVPNWQGIVYKQIGHIPEGTKLDFENMVLSHLKALTTTTLASQSAVPLPPQVDTGEQYTP